MAAAARQLGVSRMTLHRLLRGEQAVTPEMVLRLGKLCGNGPDPTRSKHAAATKIPSSSRT